MDKNNPEIGVITEQGFVAGLGLGYTPTNLGKDDKKDKDNNDKEKQG